MRENGGRPGPLELDVPPLVMRVDHLAKEDGAAVAELGDPDAELVPGVDCRDRFAPRQPPVTIDGRDELRPGQFGAVEVEQGGRRRVGGDQPGRRQRGGIDPLVEGVGEPREGVVPAKGLEGPGHAGNVVKPGMP